VFEIRNNSKEHKFKTLKERAKKEKKDKGGKGKE
jgi:hypothetical protein